MVCRGLEEPTLEKNKLQKFKTHFLKLTVSPPNKKTKLVIQSQTVLHYQKTLKKIEKINVQKSGKTTNFYRKFHQKNHHQWEIPSLWLLPKVIFSKQLFDEAYKNPHYRERNFSKNIFVSFIRRIFTGEKGFSCD